MIDRRTNKITGHWYRDLYKKAINLEYLRRKSHFPHNETDWQTDSRHSKLWSSYATKNLYPKGH